VSKLLLLLFEADFVPCDALAKSFILLTQCIELSVLGVDNGFEAGKTRVEDRAGGDVGNEEAAVPKVVQLAKGHLRSEKEVRCYIVREGRKGDRPEVFTNRFVLFLLDEGDKVGTAVCGILAQPRDP
jgi:hypothetical protein